MFLGVTQSIQRMIKPPVVSIFEQRNAKPAEIRTWLFRRPGLSLVN